MKVMIRRVRALGFLTGALFWFAGAAGVRAQSASAVARFTTEEQTLFETISLGYALGPKFLANPHDPAEALPFLQSANSRLRAVAGSVSNVVYLHTLARAAQQATQQRIAGQVPVMQGFMLGMGVNAFASWVSGDDGPGLREMAQGVEWASDAVNLQNSVNAQYAIAYLTLGVYHVLGQQLAAIGTRPWSGETVAGNLVVVKLDSAAGPLGFVDVINTSTNTLHHCLLTTQAAMDTRRLESVGAMEDLFGELGMRLVGFSGDLADASVRAGRMLRLVAWVDRNFMAYVPEFPRHERVRLRLCEPGNFYLVFSAEVSFWTDEVSGENRMVPNIYATKVAAETRRRQAALAAQRARQLGGRR